MRYQKIWYVVVLVTVVAGAALMLQAQEKQRSLAEALGSRQYANCGLEKLTFDEQRELLSQFSVGDMPSYADQAAFNYMQKEGWRLVRVIGAIKTDDAFDEYWPVVWDNYHIYTLDPFSTDILPDPGVHWAKNTLSSWYILYPDGEDVSFTARDLR